MKKGEVKFFKCNHCGNLIEMINNSGVRVVCCGEKMEEILPNTVEASVEKHLPVITKVDDCTIRVDVGSVAHPMLPEHFIEFIYLETETGVQRIPLSDKPSTEFCICKGKPIAVYAYCNLHGLWKTEIK
jgi:superoxide reductase